MEKTSDQAWTEFKKSATYTALYAPLFQVFSISGVPAPEEITELTIKTCFLQGYIYRNL